jgi:Protein of unknown function (DUF4054)
MAFTLAAKDPSEIVDYVWNPIPPGDTGDTISGSAVSSVVAGTVTRVVTNTATQVKVVVTGGADGEIAAIELRVTTTQGRTWEETLYIPVQTSAYAGLAAQLSVVFPEFASVPAASVKYWLDRAAITFAADEHNQMLLACHQMALNGLGSSSDAETHREGFDRLTALKSGTLSLNFAERSQAEATNPYLATRYGRQVWPAIRALNMITVAPTGGFPIEGEYTWPC